MAAELATIGLAIMTDAIVREWPIGSTRYDDTEALVGLIIIVGNVLVV